MSVISNGVLWWVVRVLVEDLVIFRIERFLSVMFRVYFYGGGVSLGSFVGGFVVMRFSLVVFY